jgi:hypothetical protein
MLISQTNTLINPNVVQEVSKNVKHIPNVDPFVSQFIWKFFSIVNKKQNKKMISLCCEQLCDYVETCNLINFENIMKFSVIQYVYHSNGFCN